MQSMAGVMRGAGDTLTPMWISLLTTVGLRVPIAYGLAYFTRSEAYPVGRPEAIYISALCAWIMGALVNFIAYRKGRWRARVREYSGTEVGGGAG